MNKKLLICILGLTIVSFVVMKIAFASIIGSAHDFSEDSWSGGQTCVVCHTPHSAPNTDTPLWNHAVTTATFTLYDSDTLTATLGQPNPASKACLSCHDGTVAINSFGGVTGSELITGGNDLIGTNLSNDHPISFIYDANLVTNDGGLNDPNTPVAILGTGKTIDNGMLMNHSLECSSCHDVHKTKGYSVSSSKLLLVNNSFSGLCLTCHKK